MMNDDLSNALRKLKFFYLADHLEEFLGACIKKHLPPATMIDLIVKNELEDKTKRFTDARLKAARLGTYKPHVEFDWAWPKKISRSQIEQLFSMSFLETRENIVFVSTAGLGKTMLSKNLAHKAALMGTSSLFVEAAEMLAELGSQETHRGFKLKLMKYTKPTLLVLDEVGYLSYTAKSADILFQVINQRYEKSSTIVTTNKAFKDWGTMFPGAGCVTAMIDRLTHHAEIVLIEGESYRKWESENKSKVKAKENMNHGAKNSPNKAN